MFCGALWSALKGTEAERKIRCKFGVSMVGSFVILHHLTVTSSRDTSCTIFSHYLLTRHHITGSLCGSVYLPSGVGDTTVISKTQEGHIFCTASTSGLKQRYCSKRRSKFEVLWKVNRITFLKIYLFSYLLTPWSKVLLEKLTASHSVKKFPHFMVPERSLPHSQVPATCPYPEAARSNPCPHIPLPKDPP
jgi:hypothetical protein